MTLPDGPVSPPVRIRGALVTGAGGFIGRALMRCLVARGVRVCGADLPGRLAGTGGRSADFTDVDSARAQIAAAARDIGKEATVFHLAGIAHAGLCRDAPSAAFSANVAATANVLEACRVNGLRRVVFPSTALVYSLPRPLPIDEDAPVSARSIYAASKIAAEALLAGYARDFGFSVDIARLGNVYGPDGPADSVVGTLLRQVAREGRIQLKTLAPVRDFVHRDDVAEGLARLGEAGAEPGLRIFNLSSGVATSVGTLAELMAEAAGRPFLPVELEPGTGQDDRLVLDVQRLRHRTGWVPARSLLDGLKEALRTIGEQRE